MLVVVKVKLWARVWGLQMRRESRYSAFSTIINQPAGSAAQFSGLINAVPASVLMLRPY